MSVYITEFQDANGDVVYPHTDSRVVWRPNGNRLEDTMKAIESTLNGATTTTDLPVTNSSTILATSKAVNAVYSNLGGITLSVGEDGKPYANYKVGADSVSKKLGSTCVLLGGAGSYNLTALYPNDEITIDSILLVTSAATASKGGGIPYVSSWHAIYADYIPPTAVISDGILTISNGKLSCRWAYDGITGMSSDNSVPVAAYLVF